ncbi:transposase DDE domain protein [Leptospira alexanderi serovar Manhao 3 str. L 60]|uniref:Transposase DDE domain protein n=1 Tax=Leptospira alexanderi serovar Manhao 3 str. L 60 TaxID=1049759 RepID=V6I8B1_9LEPT|nr:transposase DDE domain protein [Leptospira alexanderi serovar Manhao 3 str. L 60]
MHLIVNDQGEILSFMITPGNVDDRNSKVIFPLVKNIHDKNLPSPVLSYGKNRDRTEPCSLTFGKIK